MSPLDLLLIIGSFVPGVIYLLLVSRSDRRLREPRKYLLGVYALGMFAVVPAAFLELAGGELVFGPVLTGRGSALESMLAAFLLIGPVEEVCKYLAVRSIYEGPHFNTPLDGVVYAVAAAMGFASLENALYVAEFGWEVLWLRALLAIPGHLVFSAVWGYQLGRRKFGLGGRLLQGVALAAFLHGLYDALLMAGPPWVAGLVVPLLAGMLWIFRRQLRELKQLAAGTGTSASVARRLSCECGQRAPSSAESCPACGSDQLTLVCSGCGAETSWRRHHCAKCGLSFYDRALVCQRCRQPFPPHLPRCPLCQLTPKPAPGQATGTRWN